MHGQLGMGFSTRHAHSCDPHPHSLFGSVSNCPNTTSPPPHHNLQLVLLAHTAAFWLIFNLPGLELPVKVRAGGQGKALWGT